MSVFTRVYDRVLEWGEHRRAAWYMAGLSFAESTFFPIPPDVMLVPMMLARPDRAWFFAFICTIFSVGGGLIGYLIGAYAFPWIESLVVGTAYQDLFTQALLYYGRWGFWIILIAGISPIPYKVFTITAGVAGIPLVAFFFGSVIGRGSRFFLEAALISWGGEDSAKHVRTWIDRFGWVALILVVLVILYLQFLH